jgi:hypothetical protein
VSAHTLTTELVALSKLKPHPANARKHPQSQIDALKASLEKYGYVRPFSISRRSGLTLDGNGMITAAHQLGHKTVPVVYHDLDEAGERRFIATINKTFELGENDPVALCALLRDLADEPEGLPSGWDAEEVGNLMLALAGAGDEDALEVEAPSPNLNQKPLTTCPECGYAFA